MTTMRVYKKDIDSLHDRLEEFFSVSEEIEQKVNQCPICDGWDEGHGVQHEGWCRFNELLQSERKIRAQFRGDEPRDE